MTKELTLEEAKAKIAELELKLNPPPPTEEQIALKERQQKFFKELSRGAKFIEFIFNDLNKIGYDREKRRRLIKEMMNKKFSIEFIQTYVDSIDNIIAYLDDELKELKKEEPKDGVEYYKEVKETASKETKQ